MIKVFIFSPCKALTTTLNFKVKLLIFYNVKQS